LLLLLFVCLFWLDENSTLIFDLFMLNERRHDGFSFERF
jgi:hypothetical protein